MVFSWSNPCLLSVNPEIYKETFPSAFNSALVLNLLRSLYCFSLLISLNLIKPQSVLNSC